METTAQEQNKIKYLGILVPIIKFRIKLDEKQRKRNKYKLTVRTEMWEFEDKRENSRYPFHLSCNSTSQNEKKR